MSSGNGTKRPIRDVRSPVANGGKADEICSGRVLLSLTHSGHSLFNFAVMHNPAFSTTMWQGPILGLRGAMRRREFITLLGGAAAAWPLAARAQQPSACGASACSRARPRTIRISQARLAAFLQGLQQLGWTDGRNVRIDYRWGAGNADNFRKYAAELVALAPDVILATGADWSRCFRRPAPCRSCS